MSRSDRIRRIAVLAAALGILAVIGAPATLAGVPASASLTIAKVTVPEEDPQDFYFDLASIVNTTLDTDTSDGTVQDSEKIDLQASAFGIRTLHETPVAGWTLTDVDCTGDADVTYDAQGAVLDIDAGDNITCTFTNTKDQPTQPPATPTPTQDEGGATQAGTDTEQTNTAASGSNNVVLLIVALGVLSAVLLVTRPKRKGR